MRLEFAILAEAAALSSDGRFSLLNAEVGAIQAAAFPVTHAVLACVAKISSSRSAAEEKHTFRLEVWGPDGTQITGPARGLLPFQVNRFEPDNDTATAGVVATMPALTFPAPGKYQLRLFIDEEELANLPLYAMLNPSLAADSTSAQAPTDESSTEDTEAPS